MHRLKVDVFTKQAQCEVGALGVITISRECFERCCSNKKTLPYRSACFSSFFCVKQSVAPVSFVL